MAKTLADLRADKPRSRPERVIPLCLAPHLVAEVQTLLEELEALPAAIARGQEAGEDGPPPRMSDGEDPRGQVIRARLAEVLADMEQYEGLLRLRATPADGDWRLWVNEHPARGEDKPSERQRDLEITRGYCNADDLIDDLAKYAYQWGDDLLEEGDWESLFEPNISGPDKKQLAQAVVAMYEVVDNVPKWGSALSEILRRWPDAAPPAPSDAPPPSTSAESQPSDTSTTTPTTS